VKMHPTSLSAVFEIVSERVVDDRGFFARLTDHSVLEELTNGTWKSPYSAISHNKSQYTLRGLHWQLAQAGETKLVRCIAGSVFDVVVNVDPASKEFGQWTSVVLDSETFNSLLIPPNHAHGFLTLQEDSRVLYEISGEYRPEHSRTCHWADKDLGIAWPYLPRVVGHRDAVAGLLTEVAPPQVQIERIGSEA
jgi:dTDP-4-dehydrorhamnose 3,5-epimerase